MSKKLILAGCLFFLMRNISFSQQQNFEFLHGLRGTTYHQINYHALQQTYHIYVMAPEKIDNDQKLPTVYLLDAGITYPLLASYYNYLRLGEELPPLVIVGISYGTNDWQKGNMRSRDFTAHAADRSFWGGAPDFAEFLSAALFPLIEDNYPSEAAKRIIFGQSLGGQFALYAAQAKPNLFFGHIASNPALHRNLDFFLETKPVTENQKKISRVFVSSGSEDDTRFREPLLKWIQFWHHQQNPPWLLKTVTLEGHGHFSAAPIAFRNGLRWILQEK
ncbi:MAG: alpha/beta hydrolase [Calditrichaeota bacterium]|nr:MAG: alpha/beta hydrolase [Calditrichota bacterium]